MKKIVSSKSASEVFGVSEEEGKEIDRLRETFSDKADLRAVLEDYFHVYDDWADMSPSEFDKSFDEYKGDEIVNSRKQIKSGRIDHYKEAYLGGMIDRNKFKKLIMEEGYDDQLADYLIEKMCGNSIKCSKDNFVKSLMASGYSRFDAENIAKRARM